MFIRSALAAQPGKAQAAALDLAAGVHGCRLSQLLGDCDAGKIDDPAAICADKMHMGGGIAVEPLDPFYCAQGLDQALIFKKGEVAVDGGQGDIRHILTDTLVYPLGAGVQVGGADTLQYGVPLPEMLASSFHRYLLHVGISCLHPDHIIGFLICQ